MDTSKAEAVTRKHIARVKELISVAVEELVLRAQKHDDSKFNLDELEPLQRIQDLIDKEGQAPFGSEEYKRRTALLGNMITLHHQRNRHHPEHFENGVNGMDLIDVLEMFMDWKAASERGEEPSMNLALACERFGIDEQLKSILYNTAQSFEFRTDAQQ